MSRIQPFTLLLIFVISYLFTITQCIDFDEASEADKQKEKDKPSSKDSVENQFSDDDDGDEAGSQDKQNKTELDKDMAEGLKDFAAVSRDALIGAWKMNFNNDSEETPVLTLLEGINNAYGEERLNALRILEMLDQDMNGQISAEEFAATYGPAVSSVDQAIELMYRVYDYDANGVISIYETLTTFLTLDGINNDIYDKYAASKFDIHDKDVDGDGTVNLHEFMVYMVLELNYGIAEKWPGAKAKG